MKKRSSLLAARTWVVAIALLVCFPAFSKSLPQRLFMAHRGVNLKKTLAGENSVEAIRFSKLAGFQTIETDVRLTKDHVAVIMHDSTLNRTCLNADGSKIKEPVEVRNISFDQLRHDYRLRAADKTMRTPIPTLHEYLTECKKQNIFPFIEPKLNDETGEFYKTIIKEAEEILGKGNFVVTSNNYANEKIRQMGCKDVKLMGILYQTTYNKIAALGNAIMAVSSSVNTPEQFTQWIARANKDGIPTESAAMNFTQFNLIASNPVKYIATNSVAPDWKNQGRIIYEQNYNKVMQWGEIDRLAYPFEVFQKPLIHFGAVFLTIQVMGDFDFRINGEQFHISSPKIQTFRYQTMFCNMRPQLRLQALSEKHQVKNINVKIVDYEK